MRYNGKRRPPRRQVELDDKEEVCAIVSEPAPETCREAVAEYYRRLSAN